jgi:amino-acid N-acetyltransferase
MMQAGAPADDHSLSQDSVVLRPARKQDQSLIRSLIRSEHLNPLSLDWRHFWLGETRDGEVVVCGQIKTHNDESRELASLVVLPDWRGRGLAAAMIAKLKDVAGPPLWLTCRASLVPFYERFGFKEETDSPDLPPYFRRIRRVAGTLMRLARADRTLAIMRWVGLASETV